MRFASLHPFGLTLLAASVLLAGAMRLLPGLDRWSEQAPWLLIWGLLAYAASVTALRGSGPPAPGLGTPRTVDELMEAAVGCRADIKRQVRADAIEHPAALVLLTAAAVSAVYLWGLASAGSGAWAAALLVVTGAAGVGTLLWRLVYWTAGDYDKRTQEMLRDLSEKRSDLEQAEVRQTRNTLRRRFERIGSEDGRKALDGLVREYERLRSDLSDRRETDPLTLFPVMALATESYRRGLEVLSSALELMRAADGPGPEDLVEELRLSTDQLLLQASRSETALHRTRIQLAAIRTGTSESSVDSVVGVLQGTIDRAKEVQQELSRLGY